ncbi:MAG: protein translocase subunit SecD, partial [Fidelibacterota bacterium]
ETLAEADTTTAKKPEAKVSEDKTISVNELFGEAEETATDTTTDTSVVVDQRLFEERPFSSLLRNLGRTIGVPEKNVYAVKKILALPEVQTRLQADNGQFLFGHKANVYTTPEGGEERIFPLYYLERNPELSGGVIEEARARLGSSASSNSGQPIVLLSMNSEGSRQWARVTGANVGREVAIVLDKKVRMAPNIREKISGGNTQIEGFANIQEAKDIAIVLRAGALPAPVKIIEERIVGPSLGADSIREGTVSVIVGLALVVLFVLVYYKWSGAIADFALFWNLVLVLSILASLKATLTLPGIAGLILTVGMSIDANVIIFERIREELRKGKTPRAAVDAGYSNALSTIIDANVTTLIAALVLYQFGTGPVRGFSTVLFWGIVISMFTAIFVTRTIFNTFINRKGVQRLSI